MVRFLADHNDINIFQPNEIKPDENGVTRGMMYPAPPVPDGIGIEWYAEKDVYVVMSNCPYADQALPLPEQLCGFRWMWHNLPYWLSAPQGW